jgi:hypothetical protein
MVHAIAFIAFICIVGTEYVRCRKKRRKKMMNMNSES